MDYFWTGWQTAWWIEYISPAIWLAGTVSQHGLWLHAWGSRHVSELILRAALPQLSAAGSLQVSLVALLVLCKHLKGVWGHWFIPSGRVGRQLTLSPSVTPGQGSKCHINTSVSCTECRTRLCGHVLSQMPIDPWKARAGRQYLRSGKDCTHHGKIAQVLTNLTPPLWRF